MSVLDLIGCCWFLYYCSS